MDRNLETLAPRIVVREVEDGGKIANAMFRRCHGEDAPDYPHHVLAFWHDAARETPLCYINFLEQGELLLGGGACVDKAALRTLPADLRAAIRDAGGLYQYSLAWAVRHFASRFPAVFGYCADRLAERVDLAVGFEKTRYPRLLAYFTRPLDAARQQALIEQANAVGPF
jgi:hypothetical protein